MKKSLFIILSFVLLTAILVSSFAFIQKANADTAMSFTISSGYFRGIPKQTTFSAFKSAFVNSNNWNWFIYPDNAQTKYDYLTTSSTRYIGTGFTFRIERSFSVTDSYDIVVLGDINGDGEINQADYIQLKSHVKKQITLTGCYLKAADLNDDGRVTSTDYLRIKRYLVGLYDIDGRIYETDPIETQSTINASEQPWYSGWH